MSATSKVMVFTQPKDEEAVQQACDSGSRWVGDTCRGLLSLMLTVHFHVLCVIKHLAPPQLSKTGAFPKLWDPHSPAKPGALHDAGRNIMWSR